MLFMVAAADGCGHAGPASRSKDAMPRDTCQEAIDQFLRKDFATWRGLPRECDLERISTVLTLGEGTRRLDLGREHRPSQVRVARVDGYEEPLEVCHRDGQIAKISVRFPKLGDVAAALAGLGEPDAKLGYYYSSVPVLHEDGEWVYASKGITLFMSSDKRNVVALSVYAPTTVAAYERELHYVEAPREHPSE
jgi:hypothetical protein